jgi:hypothetical protein
MEETEQAWHALCDRWGKTGLRGFSPAEKVWFCVRTLIDAINNGGLISYFYNSNAAHIKDCQTALGVLNAPDVATQLARAAKLFGRRVPTDIEARNRIINSWTDDGPESTFFEHVDAAVEPLLDDLERKLSAYLASSGLVP